MPDAGLIASQWDSGMHQRLLALRPGLRLLPLPRGPLQAPLPDDARVLLVRPFTPAEREHGPPPGWPFGLRFVQLISVGFDFYPRWLLNTPGLPVATAHGSSAEVIADFALAQILRVQLRLQERRARAPADWRFTEAPALAGARLGVLGFGAIAQALARRALALGLQVHALRRSDGPLPVPGVQAAASLEQLLAESDHLVLAAPATPATQHLINTHSLRHARPGLHLINLARGSLVDTEALRPALDDGRLAWASLDVTDPEPLPPGHWLYQHPRVWLTPHTSAISPQVQQAVVEILVGNLARVSKGEGVAPLLDLGRGY